MTVALQKEIKTRSDCLETLFQSFPSCWWMFHVGLVTPSLRSGPDQTAVRDWLWEDGDIMSKVLIGSPVAAGFKQLIDSWDFLRSVPLSKSSHYAFHGLTVVSHDFPLICAAVTVGPASRHSWWTAQSGLPSPHHHHTELVCLSRGCSPIITFPWHKGRGYKWACFTESATVECPQELQVLKCEKALVVFLGVALLTHNGWLHPWKPQRLKERWQDQ